MLHSIKLNDQTYEQLLSEAVSRIPLYTSEWTNFNPSDPGITILQNLSAFSILQQSLMDEVTDELREKLLGILGFYPDKLSAAKLLVRPEEPKKCTLFAHEKLLLGNLSFETIKKTEYIPWFIKSVYSKIGEKINDITKPLRYGQHASVQIFGNSPKTGDSVIFILDGDITSNMTLHMYSDAVHDSWRNPFDDDTLRFAKIKWEYYTDNGWHDASCFDETHDFLVSGGIHITLGKKKPKVYKELSEEGYAVRCVLEHAEYDIAPRITQLNGGLFEVEQRDTHAAAFVFDNPHDIHIQSAMTRNENMFVYYCNDNDIYMPCYEANDAVNGLFYKKNLLDDGTVTLEFDKSIYEGKKCNICVVCYDLNTLNQRYIGTAYGYEDQTIDITGFNGILPEYFSVLAEITLQDGQIGYKRIFPNDKSKNSILYELRPTEGQIKIIENSLSGAAKLFICDMATTSGETGNLREVTRLNSAPDPYFPDEVRGPYYIAPGRGSGGHSSESIAQLRRRMINALHNRGSSVSEKDYENAVKKTSGLCIHKVRAVSDSEKNIVRITVKCHTEDDRAQLPNCYLEQIRKKLDECRMISTKVELYEPQYVPIDVSLIVHVRNYYENARLEITQMLEKELDYIKSERNFGEIIRYTDIYRKIESLRCVDRIYSLVLHPAQSTQARMKGSDIILGESSLCHLGKLDLEINSSLAR